MWQTCGTSKANISQITSPYANTSTLSVRGPASFISILCHGSDPMYVCLGFRGPVRSSFKKMDTPKSQTFTKSKSPFTWEVSKWWWHNWNHFKCKEIYFPVSQWYRLSVETTIKAKSMKIARPWSMLTLSKSKNTIAYFLIQRPAN